MITTWLLAICLTEFRFVALQQEIVLSFFMAFLNNFTFNWLILVCKESMVFGNSSCTCMELKANLLSLHFVGRYGYNFKFNSLFLILLGWLWFSGYFRFSLCFRFSLINLCVL